MITRLILKGGNSMLNKKEEMNERMLMCANYIIKHNATVRATAKAFGISKSTVHKDVTERLKKSNSVLYKKVRKVLNKNKEERHIRGGLATRRKYKGEK